ncbi:DNA-3-methyladenine glycosylase I [Propioniciclava flava]|uniref:3-methyladenine DNA glycosylase n=1 Tax=Propioniciclava flava TaxID=2072026 RepID=A0A4Q2EHJ3_9ACTN|nr:DNA-3-methyladenine glycosylase I [Propioniciclava flava]RXW33040.1 3-methyladenine DNA glycosylase [Propioniciclava flava]
MNRPGWAETSDLLREYYDHEWGLPVRDTPGVYERITLEGFQSGLSWETVLRKRPAFRQAFVGFDPAAVAQFGAADVERLMTDASIVRNRRKIEAAITNAQATVALSDAGEDLADVVWSFQPADPRGHVNATQSPESVALAAALKKRGFVFVGPVTMFALMQAIGLVQHRLA